MRDTDEQLREIMCRAEVVRGKRVIQKRLRQSAWASLVCAALLVAVFVSIPRPYVERGSVEMQRYGSLLLEAPYMGYAAIGVAAFALGVCVTLLCFHWKRLKEKERVRR